MYFDRYPTTDYSQYNLDAITRELSEKISNPGVGESGDALMIDEDGEIIWGNPAEITSVDAENVSFDKTGTSFTKDNVQEVLNECNTKFSSINTQIQARPIKEIRLNNVTLQPDANGMVNIVIADGNNIYY